MPNVNRQDQNRYKVLGALGLRKQGSGAAPIGSTEYGMFIDSNGKPVISFNGLAGSLATMSGIVPSARLVLVNQPSNNDTIGIGAITFKFVSALVAAGAQVQVKISAVNAAATLASLVKAINGTVAAAEWTEATTPFAAAVVADAVSTSLRIRLATARGGTAIAGASGSLALAEAITDASDIWNCANLNVSGKAPADSRISKGSVAITAQMVTNGSFQVELPFTPTAVHWTGYTSAGVFRAVNEAVTISTNAINLVLAGGASPNWQAGDIFQFCAIE